MNIPLLDKKDVETEEEHVEIEECVEIEEPVDKYIRDEIIVYLKSKGWKYLPADDESEDETNDFFTKDGKLVQVTINDDIPKEVIERMGIESI